MVQLFAMASNIYQQFSLPSIYGESFNHSSKRVINERIIVPVLSTESGPKFVIPRVAEEKDETLPALMTIAHRIGAGGVPLAGLRVTFAEEVRLQQDLPYQYETIAPFSSLSAKDDKPNNIEFSGSRTSTLTYEPALAVIIGLRSILINKYTKD